MAEVQNKDIGYYMFAINVWDAIRSAKMTTHVYNPVLSEADAREIFYALQDEDLQLRIGPDGENLLEPEFAMTPELAQAIYSDVQTKLAAVREGFYGRDNTTREWKQHLLAILETIGDDGENLLRS